MELAVPSRIHSPPTTRVSPQVLAQNYAAGDIHEEDARGDATHVPEELSADLACSRLRPGNSWDGLRSNGWRILRTGGSIARMMVAFWARVAATGGR